VLTEHAYHSLTPGPCLHALYPLSAYLGTCNALDNKQQSYCPHTCRRGSAVPEAGCLLAHHSHWWACGTQPGGGGSTAQHSVCSSQWGVSVTASAQRHGHGTGSNTQHWINGGVCGQPVGVRPPCNQQKKRWQKRHNKNTPQKIDNASELITTAAAQWKDLPTLSARTCLSAGKW
jgi:hypothetical protein